MRVVSFWQKLLAYYFGHLDRGTRCGGGGVRRARDGLILARGAPCMAMCKLCGSRPKAAAYDCCGKLCAQAMKVAEGTFTIVNPSSGLVLDINERSEKVQLWQYTGNANQLWQYNFTTRAIFNPSSGKALDIDVDDGTKITVWRQNQKPNQE